MGSAARRIWHHVRSSGVVSTVRFIATRLLRYEHHAVYEMRLSQTQPPPQWGADEYVRQIGPENIDRELTPQLVSFLGGHEALGSVEGVRNGDRLFIIGKNSEYVHRGYILFTTRQKQILGELHDAPLIASCWTRPTVRGQGIYRRALAEEAWYLRRRGYERVIIETDPDNNPSRKGIEGSGFSLAWTVRVVIFLNRLAIQNLQTPAQTRWRVVFVR